MDKRQKILEFIRINGPALPAQIAKQIETDQLMASAFLSELTDKKQLKLSSLKVGSTPLYFLPGQESNLQKFSDNLHEKARKAYAILKEKKILKDSELEPVIRVALRDIKDFAIPLNVTYEDKKETFWKWYLLDNAEAENIIKGLLNIKIPEPEPKSQEKILEKAEQARELPQPTNESKAELKVPENHEKEPRKIQPKKPKKDFSEAIKNYFEKNGIKLSEEKLIRKNAEFDYIIEIPSNVGNLSFYCKAKSKAKISDSDLASAFATGQVKKLPVLFLSNGDLTKKAKESLNDFKGLTVKKI